MMNILNEADQFFPFAVFITENQCQALMGEAFDARNSFLKEMDAMNGIDEEYDQSSTAMDKSINVPSFSGSMPLPSGSGGHGGQDKTFYFIADGNSTGFGMTSTDNFAIRANLAIFDVDSKILNIAGVDRLIANNDSPTLLFDSNVDNHEDQFFFKNGNLFMSLYDAALQQNVDFIINFMEDNNQIIDLSSILELAVFNIDQTLIFMDKSPLITAIKVSKA